MLHKKKKTQSGQKNSRRNGLYPQKPEGIFNSAISVATRVFPCLLRRWAKVRFDSHWLAVEFTCPATWGSHPRRTRFIFMVFKFLTFNVSLCNTKRKRDMLSQNNVFFEEANKKHNTILEMEKQSLILPYCRTCLLPSLHKKKVNNMKSDFQLCRTLSKGDDRDENMYLCHLLRQISVLSWV